MRTPWWTPGDLNGFFGLFTNSLTNVMVLSGLLTFVVKLPDDLVYGRIVPAVGLSILFGNLFYAWLGRRLSEKEGRGDVTALPYGVSVPHMFIVVFLVVGPVYWKTGNATLAWQVGLAWCVIEAIVEVAGAFIGPTIRKYTPRAAILGTLAGVSIAYIALRPAAQAWEVPYIGMVSLAIIILGWFASRRYPGNVPAGLVAIIVGTVLGWATGYMKPDGLTAAIAGFSVSVPLPYIGDVLAGLGEIGPYLAVAIPLGVYNFFETMSNVESAAAAGDEYDTRICMLYDGGGSALGALFGSVFPTAVYIGHPGWKSVGARIGYSAATGIAIFLVSTLGVLQLLLSIIPLVAILPILLYIGLVIGAQAFQAIPARHAPAVVLSLVPWMADWGRTQINGALGAAGTSAADLGMQALMDQGVVYQGMAILGDGAILVGMLLGAIAAFAIDHKLRLAALYAGIGALLSFFGIIHAGQLGINMAPGVAIGYVLMAGLFLGMERMGTSEQTGAIHDAAD
jgi:adenine/guanine/hypoxanthine permease